MVRNRLRYFTTVRLVNAVQGKGGNKSQSKVLFYVTDFQSRTSSTSSLGSIYHPPDCATENETLSKLIRNGISSHDIEESGTHKTDTGMSLCFLGTAAGLPSLRRSTSATLLRMGGSSFLFDAGEGVQRQLMFTRAKPSHIERIFVTHLHGDHIYGLPGLILGLQRSISALKDDPRKKNSKKKKALEDHKVKIYGPPGLYNYIASNIVLSCTKLHSISIEVHELVGGRVRRTHGGRDMRNPFEASYPEFNYGCLVRKKIECENGVWNIEDVPRITRDEIMKSNLRNESRGVRIKAAEVDHLSGVATFGFVVEEDEPARNIDPVKAQELGVSPQGKKYSLLKYGFSVLADDGETEVHSNEVLKPRTKSARKVTIVGDNRGWTSEMAAIAKNSDVLIHEATLLEEDSSVSLCLLLNNGR